MRFPLLQPSQACGQVDSTAVLSREGQGQEHTLGSRPLGRPASLPSGCAVPSGQRPSGWKLPLWSQRDPVPWQKAGMNRKFPQFYGKKKPEWGGLDEGGPSQPPEMWGRPKLSRSRSHALLDEKLVQTWCHDVFARPVAPQEYLAGVGGTTPWTPCSGPGSGSPGSPWRWWAVTAQVGCGCWEARRTGAGPGLDGRLGWPRGACILRGQAWLWCGRGRVAQRHWERGGCARSDQVELLSRGCSGKCLHQGWEARTQPARGGEGSLPEF